ncbi:MAG: hypothetical protein K8R11_08690 [Methanococcoides sp.]|nr:hypothetical protein [Methanococcoides sp.]
MYDGQLKEFCIILILWPYHSTGTEQFAFEIKMSGENKRSFIGIPIKYQNYH